MQTKIFNVCLFFLVNVFSYTINAVPHQRFRRQLNPHRKDGLPYAGWGGGTNNPSGGSPGAYYGSGVNPNYGMIQPNINDADNGIAAISYSNGYNSNWNQQQQPQQQQQYYPYNNNNNNNNQWQGSNMNSYYNQPNNPYQQGNPGMYGSGGSFWYNKGQSLIPHACLLIISILISIICI